MLNLITAITAGEISAYAKRRAEEAERQKKEIEKLYEELKTAFAKASEADALLEFARENGITHVIFGQSARMRWEIMWKGSIINRFLREVKDADVHVIPLEKEKR